MASIEFPSNIDQAKDAAAELWKHRKVWVLAIGAALLSLLLLVALFARGGGGGSGYAVLFAHLSHKQGGQVLSELQKRNVPFHLAEGGSVIEVPKSRVDALRLTLAEKGVPRSGNHAWVQFTHEKLGTSNFVAQKEYQRSLEARLSHTIASLSGVSSASVSLALPAQTAFLTKQPKPSASVALQLQGGFKPTRQQIYGIAYLVASSVPGLSRKAVKVVGPQGRLLSARHNGLGAAPREIKLTRHIEAHYRKLIKNMLMPVVGGKQFRVAVNAHVVFGTHRQSQVKYGQHHVLSQSTKKTLSQGEHGGAKGIAGALSNQAPTGPKAPFSMPKGQKKLTFKQYKSLIPKKSTSSKTKNYDVNKTVSYSHGAPWHLAHINVSVLINKKAGLSKSSLKQVKSLVTGTLGRVAANSVNVESIAFNTASVHHGHKAPKTLLQRLLTSSNLSLLVRALLVLLFGLALVFAVRRPILTWIEQREQRIKERERVIEQAQEEARERDAEAGSPIRIGSMDINDISLDDIDSVNAQINALVREEPQRVALLIREWLKADDQGVDFSNRPRQNASEKPVEEATQAPSDSANANAEDTPE